MSGIATKEKRRQLTVTDDDYSVKYCVKGSEYFVIYIQ